MRPLILYLIGRMNLPGRTFPLTSISRFRITFNVPLRRTFEICSFFLLSSLEIWPVGPSDEKSRQDEYHRTDMGWNAFSNICVSYWQMYPPTAQFDDISEYWWFLRAYYCRFSSIHVYFYVVFKNFIKAYQWYDILRNYELQPNQYVTIWFQIHYCS